MTPIGILIDEPGEEGVSRLDAAWKDPRTFVFLPRKAGIGPAQLEFLVSNIPDRYRRDHFCLLTSGTTGEPKLVIGSRARSEALARLLHRLQNSEPVRHAILTLPLTYCYSFVNQWLWSRVLGRGLAVTQGFTRPDEVLRALDDTPDSMLCLVGVQVPLLARVAEARAFPNVLRVHFAGGRFPASSWASLRSWFPRARIFNNYGCTEAMPRLTVLEASEAMTADTIGSPLPAATMREVDGAIQFQSPYSAVAWVDAAGPHEIVGWTATGDTGHCDDAGAWHVTGRAGEVFKRHGEKLSMPGIGDAVGTAWTGAFALYRERDVSGEEGYVLVMTLPGNAGDGEVRNVLRMFRERYPRAAWPLRIESVDELPLLSNGKVDVQTLAQAAGKVVRWKQLIQG